MDVTIWNFLFLSHTWLTCWGAGNICKHSHTTQPMPKKPMIKEAMVTSHQLPKAKVCFSSSVEERIACVVYFMIGCIIHYVNLLLPITFYTFEWNTPFPFLNKKQYIVNITANNTCSIRDWVVNIQGVPNVWCWCSVQKHAKSYSTKKWNPTRILQK